MASFSLSSTATLAISGITPAAGPTTSDKVNGAYTGTPITVDDRLDEVYTINANTPDTLLSLGKIVASEALWLETDGPLNVTLTQDLGAGPVDCPMRVSKFILLQSPFTAIKVANPSATTAVHFSVVVGGNRIPVGGGPGVF